MIAIEIIQVILTLLVFVLFLGALFGVVLQAIFGANLDQCKSLFKIWNFGVANTKILPCRLEKSPKIGIFSVYWPQKSTI
ncbi:MAG: hypothetical protein LBD48_02585 [Treponema sp.]|jgi:hypothetical protein|nr:hypothetical protein [Treponema sp.]